MSSAIVSAHARQQNWVKDLWGKSVQHKHIEEAHWKVLRRSAEFPLGAAKSLIAAPAEILQIVYKGGRFKITSGHVVFRLHFCRIKASRGICRKILPTEVFEIPSKKALSVEGRSLHIVVFAYSHCCLYFHVSCAVSEESLPVMHEKNCAISLQNGLHLCDHIRKRSLHGHENSNEKELLDSGKMRGHRLIFEIISFLMCRLPWRKRSQK